MFNRLSHVGVVVNDLEKAIELWTSVFGLELRHRLEIPVEGVRSALLHPRDGGTFVELIEPMNKADLSNAIARRLSRHGEGIYQLAVLVDNTEQAAETLTAAGIAHVVQPPTGPGQATRPVVHPKSANGVLLELVQQAAAGGHE